MPTQADSAAGRKSKAEQWHETLLEALEELANGSDFPDEDEGEAWRRPFLIARRIQKTILDNGYSLKGAKPEGYADAVLEVFGDDDLLALYIEAWPKIKHAEGYRIMDEIAQKLEHIKWRATLPADFPAPLRERGERLASAIYLMEEATGKHPFVSSRTAGELLDTNRNVGAAILRLLVRHGVIAIVQPADRTPGRFRAAIYAYLGQRPRGNVTHDIGAERDT